jgi:hypothetical protein
MAAGAREDFCQVNLILVQSGATSSAQPICLGEVRSWHLASFAALQHSWSLLDQERTLVDAGAKSLGR